MAGNSLTAYCVREKVLAGGRLPIMNVAHSIGESRRALGWTQRVLAARSGLTQGTVSRIEAGLIDPPLSTVARIAWEMGKILSLRGITTKGVANGHEGMEGNVRGTD